MIDRNTYCKDCDRSIYATGVLARSCDNNVEDNGYYNLAGEKCYCKIANGKIAENYLWDDKIIYSNDKFVMKEVCGGNESSTEKGGE